MKNDLLEKPPTLTVTLSEPLTTKRIDETLDLWDAETQFVSSSSQIKKHPALQFLVEQALKNVDAKEQILKKIFLRLQEKPSRKWGWAAQLMVGNEATPPEGADFESVWRFWLNWGKQNHYL